MAALLAVPRGIVAGADVVLTVLFVGGAFALLDATGALARLVGALVGRRVIPDHRCARLSRVCDAGRAREHAGGDHRPHPRAPRLSRGLGFGAITALSMSVGAAAVGSAFGRRTVPDRHRAALRRDAAAQPAGAACRLARGRRGGVDRVDGRDDRTRPGPDRHCTGDRRTGDQRDAVLLAVVLLPFIPYVFGVLRYDWGFNELSALFLIAGFAVGLFAGRSLSDTAAGFPRGWKACSPRRSSLASRARSASSCRTVRCSTRSSTRWRPLGRLPGLAAAILMVPTHALLHVPVPSVSGQAVLTMPVMAPLCDLLADLQRCRGHRVQDRGWPDGHDHAEQRCAARDAARRRRGLWPLDQVRMRRGCCVSIVGLVGIALAREGARTAANGVKRLIVLDM